MARKPFYKVLHGVTAAVVTVLFASLSVPATPAAFAAEPPTVTISGTVTGGDASGPLIAAAAVTLRDDGTPVATATTSSDGAYELTGVPADGRTFILTIIPASGSEYLRSDITPIVPNPSGPNTVDVALVLGVRISGTVALTSGQSPAGAKVTVLSSGYPVTSRTVGSDGAFDIPGLNSGTYRVRGELAGNGPVEVELKSTVLGQTYPIALDLLSPGVVSGTVTSSTTGLPVEGIDVTRNGQSTRTDADGSYALTAASIGSYPVTFSDPLGAYVLQRTAPVVVATAQSIDAVDAVLVPAAVITGTVYGSDGGPLGGVRVTSDLFGPEIWAISDFEGHYRIAGLPAGTYPLVGLPEEAPATSGHLETTGPTVTVAVGQQLDGVDFALDPFSVVSGVLTRSAPLEGDITKFRITYISLDESFTEDGTNYRRTTQPDADGRYEIGLPPGRYLIRISPPWDGATGEYDTSYEISWWENIRGDFDYEYADGSLSSGTKIFVVERTTPASLDLAINRGNSFTTVPYPTITGTLRVGQTLTATYGSWKPAASTVRFEWRRDSIPIPGATTAQYVVTDADIGTKLTFALTGSSPASGIATSVSAPVTPVRVLEPTPTPTIVGSPAVGSTLTAEPGTWGPAPVALAYQWTRNGTAIAGATAITYQVQSDDAGKKLAVTVTGSKSGYPTVSKTSVSVSVPLPPPVVERLAGQDRYEVSALVSREVAPGGSPLVYLASGENFSDSLSGSAIAAQRDAPLLLSTRSSVPASIATEIARLEPADIVVLGGENTLGPAVISQLHAIVPGATVTRIGGADRFEMSRNLIQDTEFGAASSSRLLIATGRGFPDALSATPAAASVGAPVLLVDGQRTSFTSAERKLLRDRGITFVTLMGGTASVSGGLQGQLDSLGITNGRVSGADRYVVSQKTATQFFRAQNSRDVVYIATGENFPDALSGGVLAAYAQPTPIFLAQKGCLDQGMIDHIKALKAKRIVILGGPNTIAFSSFPLPACPARG